MKDNHFKLSTSFTNLFSNKESPALNKEEGNRSLDKGLFKLNPKSAHALDDVPVEVLKKNSKSKLESLKDDGIKEKFSIFTQKMEAREVIKDKKPQPKKYHLGDLNAQPTDKPSKTPNQTQPQLPFDIVRPSRLQHLLKHKPQPQSNHSLFQTPLLPCFASEFRQNLEPSPTSFKSVQQKQGVWKIGKLKMRGKTASIKIGDIEFEAVRADVAGKAGVVAEDNFYQLRNWKDIWVVQPTEDLFR